MLLEERWGRGGGKDNVTKVEARKDEGVLAEICFRLAGTFFRIRLLVMRRLLWIGVVKGFLRDLEAGGVVRSHSAAGIAAWGDESAGDGGGGEHAGVLQRRSTAMMKEEYPKCGCEKSQKADVCFVDAAGEGSKQGTMDE